MGGDLVVDETGLVTVALDEGVDRPTEEECGDDTVDGSLREECEEPDADRGGDDDMDEECRRGAEPDGPGPAPRGEDQRAKHRLVGELADEDDREHGGGDAQVHGAPL